ncbi:hypothetical protein EDC65_2245 [Stella humosa]|uniref:Tail terminator n=1 Tax=Stella humosa TaxID=94 RepID=A0A3N1MH10_9PROT|nr:hypothetical protein [Stella humosa]ROQ00446.1 hypothetical protein EDC65_2245 [Stella humosa]BBK30309.1 hypothetical protein STHU_09430 [Stella humosa]
MPTPVVEQVLAAVEARLAAITGFPGLLVERNRDAEVDRFPTLLLIDGDQDRIGDETMGYRRVMLEFMVEGYVSANLQSGLGPARNALYAAVVAALMADPTLGGLAVDLHEGRTSRALGTGDGQTPAAAFATIYELEFWTREADPYSLGP